MLYKFKNNIYIKMGEKYYIGSNFFCMFRILILKEKN